MSIHGSRMRDSPFCQLLSLDLPRNGYLQVLLHVSVHGLMPHEVAVVRLLVGGGLLLLLELAPVL